MNRFTSRQYVVHILLLWFFGLHAINHAPPAAAAIYRWDNAALITDKDAVPGASFLGMDLGYADLAGASLSGASFSEANLTGAYFESATLTTADLNGANLTDAVFVRATLTGADLSRAVVNGAVFGSTTDSGFTAAQLYSTASYQRDDLSGIDLYDNDLSGWDFAGKNLTNAFFCEATLTDASLRSATLTAADLSGAVVSGADFRDTTGSGFTAAQLYSTASYQSSDLSGIRLSRNNLSGWDFVGKNLTDAYFQSATLTDVDLSGAVVNGANFWSTTDSGLTAEQLYSTASYQSGDLSGIGLGYNDLSGWDFAGKNLTDAYFALATLTAADLSGAVVNGAYFGYTSGFTAAQLYSTASYQSGDLSGIGLDDNDLSGWDFAGKNLTDADFEDARLTAADLSGAVVNGAIFWGTTGRGFTAEQLYSTASFQSGDLSGIGLADNDLSGWDFAGKNLTDASFGSAILTDATLTDADLSLCDLRGSDISPGQISSAASSEGAILPDGRIEGLALDASERLVVRDYDPSGWWSPPIPIPITVESGMGLDPESTLRMVFEDDDWGSTISFEPDITVSLGGTLELLFADDTDPMDLIGTTFDLFDWDGAVVSGTFDDEIVTEWEAVWDRTGLYTTGEVTLLSAVPEPSTLILLSIGAVGLLAYAWRQRR